MIEEGIGKSEDPRQPAKPSAQDGARDKPIRLSSNNEVSPQLAYYYRKGRARRKAKDKAKIKQKPIKHEVESSYGIHQKLQGSSLATKRLFLHRLYAVYPLLKPSSLKEGKQVQLRYSRQQLFQIDGISCRLTSKHFVVEGIQLSSDLTLPAPELLRYAEQQADRIAEQAMRDHALELSLTQRKTKLMEIAITNHEGARELTERRKGKIILYQEPISMKIVWADRTPNPASIESDSDKLIEPWQKFTKGLEEKTWNIDGQLAFNQQLIEFERGQQKFVKSHNDLVKETVKLIKELREERRARAQRRLED